MELSSKIITSADGLSFALLIRGESKGILQGQLADLLRIPYSSLSAIVAKHGIERHTLGRAEAKILKDNGLIHQNSRGGNFLPLDSIMQVLMSIKSESARLIEGQIQMGQAIPNAAACRD